MKGDDILKSVCREIEIVTVFDRYGNIKPIKFRLCDVNSNNIIRKLYNIKYDKEKSKWSLYGF